MHILLRSMANLVNGPARLAQSDALCDAPIVAEHRSSLWMDGREDEFLLRCGKVENLRVAIRSLHGVVVEPDQVLSFWAQVGWPGRLRGFVTGREIINGCVVPSAGGGLCQLSNALASLAEAAGMRLMERHVHSARIEQGTDCGGVDATVAWNYIDLRVSAPFRFRVEAVLETHELVVRLRATDVSQRHETKRSILTIMPLNDRSSQPIQPTARGCLTCDESECFRHRRNTKPLTARTALLLNERTPELARWLESHSQDADWLVPWLRPGRRHTGWQPGSRLPLGSQATTQHAFYIARWAGWRRMLAQQWSRGEGASRQRVRQQSAEWLAQAYAARLQPAHTALTLTQELLVPLWRSGCLGGRTFDVFMHELPGSELQKRLDAAARKQPDAQCLSDFRVGKHWLQDEWQALRQARFLVTAHADIHRTLRNAGLDCTLVPWQHGERSAASPRLKRDPSVPLTIAFAGSALARKGDFAVASAARESGARVLILGSAPSNLTGWQGVNWKQIGYVGNWIDEADVVVLPAYVEHQPRALLRALDAGLPVIASEACGLGELAGWTCVPPGDAPALKAAILQLTHSTVFFKQQTRSCEYSQASATTPN
jgi:hypothetical protein